MSNDSRGFEKWRDPVRRLPGVLDVEAGADGITAFVSSKEEGRKTREAARQAGVPDEVLMIKVLRYWLDPHPNDPKESQKLFDEQLRGWQKVDEAEEL